MITLLNAVFTEGAHAFKVQKNHNGRTFSEIDLENETPATTIHDLKFLEERKQHERRSFTEESSARIQKFFSNHF